jgi:tetratricopeptide (TPR) repeat protein
MGGGGIIPERCPECASPLKYISRYDAWYCKACKEYRDVEDVIEDVNGVRPNVPSVVPQSSTAVQERCYICLGFISDESEYFECECGNISHDSCARQVDNCSVCGKEHTRQEFVEGKGFFVFMERGRMAFNKNKYDEALNWYNKALNVKRKSAHAWNYKGTILAQQGRYDMALECYDCALEIKKSPLTCYNKAVTLLHMNMLRETLNCIIEAIELESEDGWFWYLKGCTLLKMDRSDEAVECYDRALTLISDSPLIWFGKGAALMNLDRLGEARKCYEKALVMDPGNEEVLFATGRVLLAESKTEEAISKFEEVLAKNPDHKGAKRERQSALSQSG